MDKLWAKLKDEAILPKNVDQILPFVLTEDCLYLLDQRKLPQERVVKAKDHLEVRKAIKEMVVRGAPAIGITGAIGFYLGVKRLLDKRKKFIKKKELKQKLKRFYQTLAEARPTAVNLVHALNQMMNVAESILQNASALVSFEELRFLAEELRKKAISIWEWELAANLAMAEHGKDLLPEGGILTHCNTGALATGGYGTALGVIRASYSQGKKHLVYVDETRPFLQGTRLTAWELSRLNIPFRVITDNSAGFLMQQGLVKAVIVGADRITAKGDTANKIGTYSLAVLARYHGIPFYVAAPSSTFDLKLSSGAEIPIEERSEREVLTCGGKKLSPKGARALNYAFDVTPGSLITAFITERGIINPPFEENIPKTLAQGSP